MSDEYGGREHIKRRILELAASQYGLVTRDQARVIGMSKRSIDRRIASGEWLRMYRGVYRVASAPASWHQALMAAFLWAGDNVVVSHRSAAALWKLGGFESGPVEMSIEGFRRAPLGVIVHRKEKLPPYDVTTLGLFRITEPTRTLFDLAAVASEELVENALEDALRRGLTSLPRLRWRLGSLEARGRPGVLILRRLVDERKATTVPTESILETRLLRLIRDHDLPPPVRQHELRDNGKVIARVDFAYPDVRLAIEAEGYRYHSGRQAWRRDLLRRNALTSRGWRILHVTWEEVSARPDHVVEELRRTLGF